MESNAGSSGKLFEGSLRNGSKSSVRGGRRGKASHTIFEANPSVTEQSEDATSNHEQARKARFADADVSLTQRWKEACASREAERQRLVKAGIIPDVDQAMRLEDAQDLVGTCEAMCPDFDRLDRERQGAIDRLEMYPGTRQVDPERCVKVFKRSAAGMETALPSDLRTPAALKRTVDYLFRQILPMEGKSMIDTYYFIRDRTRSVRTDFTTQRIKTAEAVECYERIVRYHILCLHELRHHETSVFDAAQEFEQLNKALVSLAEFYSEAHRHGFMHPNEPEFRAYIIIARPFDWERLREAEALPLEIFENPGVQHALRLSTLCHRSFGGKAAETSKMSPNAFSQFFKLVRSDSITFLQACLAERLFLEVRRSALRALRVSYVAKYSLIPLEDLAKMLGCDDLEHAEMLCSAFGLHVVDREDGGRAVELHKSIILGDGASSALRRSNMVADKRQGVTLPDIVDGSLQSTSTPLSSLAARVAPTAGIIGPDRTAPGSKKLTPSFGFLSRQDSSPAPRATLKDLPSFQAPPPSLFQPTVASTTPLISPLPLGTLPEPIKKQPASTNGFSFGTPTPPSFQISPLATPFSTPPAPNVKPSNSFSPTVSALSLPTSSFSLNPIAPNIDLSSSTSSASISALPSALDAPKIQSGSISPMSPISTIDHSSRPSQRAVALGFVPKLVDVLFAAVKDPAVYSAAVDALLKTRAESESHRSHQLAKVATSLANQVCEALIMASTNEASVAAVGRHHLLSSSWQRWLQRYSSAHQARESRKVANRYFKAVTHAMGIGPPSGAIYDASSALNGLRLESEAITEVGDSSTDDFASVAVTNSHDFARSLWEPRLFLSSITDVCQPQLLRENDGKLSVLVYLASLDSPWASLYRCKFGMRPSTNQSYSRRRSGQVTYEVTLGDSSEAYASADLGHAGFVIIDEASMSSEGDLEAYIAGLVSLLQHISSCSSYLPCLLLMTWSEAADGEERKVATLLPQVRQLISSLEVVELGGDAVDINEAFALAAARCLALIRPNPLDPPSIPSAEYIRPLCDAWSLAVGRALRRIRSNADEEPKAEVISIILSGLNEILAVVASLSPESNWPTLDLPDAPTLRESIWNFAFKHRDEAEFTYLLSLFGSDPPLSMDLLIETFLSYCLAYVKNLCRNFYASAADVCEAVPRVLDMIDDLPSRLDAVLPSVKIRKRRSSDSSTEDEDIEAKRIRRVSTHVEPARFTKAMSGMAVNGSSKINTRSGTGIKTVKQKPALVALRELLAAAKAGSTGT